MKNKELMKALLKVESEMHDNPSYEALSTQEQLLVRAGADAAVSAYDISARAYLDAEAISDCSGTYVVNCTDKYKTGVVSVSSPVINADLVLPPF
jgi:hypothetical protein